MIRQPGKHISPVYTTDADLSKVSESHNAVNDILSGQKTRTVRPIFSGQATVQPTRPKGNPIATPQTVPVSRNNEAVGSLKSFSDQDGHVILYRKQFSGKYAVLDSPGDTYEIDLESGLTPEEGHGTLGDMTTPVDTNLIPMADKYLDNGFNVLLIGPHGTGKTESIRQLAVARGFKMKYYSCSTLDPFTDLVGVPYPRQYCTEHGYFDNRIEHRTLHPECKIATTEQLEMVRPREVDEAELIFFDEFNRADTKTMNAIFEIIQFRSINGEPLPNLKACWAAMNPPDEDYTVENVDPALLDRFDVYVEILPKPSVSYMSKYMAEPIAKALSVWYQELLREIKSGKKDEKVSYISPRRLMKIGLVWQATTSPRAVYAALPFGGEFDRNKLVEYLKAAQKQVNQMQGTGSDEGLESEWGGSNIGDQANPNFIYKPAQMRKNQDDLVKYLEENPLAYETHQKVKQALVQGVGGDELCHKFGRILNALNPSILEGMISGYPVAKQSHMRSGFAKLFNEDPDRAKELTTLHKVLKQGAKGNTGFPMTL